MQNKVLIEGEIESYKWSTNKTGFFVTIKQVRKFGNKNHIDFFRLYANDPLNKQLEAYVKKYATIAIEGVLETYQDKKTKQWNVNIRVIEIIINEK